MEQTRREVIETLERKEISAKLKNLALDGLVQKAQESVIDHYHQVMDDMLAKVKESPENAVQIIENHMAWELLNVVFNGGHTN